jgi:hypothetical protein
MMVTGRGVSVLTRVLAGFPGYQGSIPEKTGFFVSSTTSDSRWGPPTLLSNEHRGPFQNVAKRQGCEIHHSLYLASKARIRGAVPTLHLTLLLVLFNYAQGQFCLI